MLYGIITVVLLVLFVVGWVWAWSPRRKREFDAAARLPLDDMESTARNDAGERNKEPSP